MSSERLFAQKLQKGIVTMFALVVLAASPAATAQGYNVIGAFNGSGGKLPGSNVIFDASGNLYGTTLSGGLSGPCAGLSCGVAYRLSPVAGAGWKETVMHRFTGGNDGGQPQAGLALDSSGNFYGTTFRGGLYGPGTVFRLAPTSNGGWKETVLHSFTGGRDGGYPMGGVTVGANGHLYGTASSGGSSGQGGVVFELSPQTGGGWRETVLYNFTGVSDGSSPSGGLTFDAAGNIYGATLGGGNITDTCSHAGALYCGVAFELSANGSGGWTESVMHAFNGADGFQPQGSLIFDASGNLYGTTTYGGALCSSSTGCCCGVVYELSPNPRGGWSEKEIFAFQLGSGGFGKGTGANPFSGVTFDASGNLYGTTNLGGTHDSGVVFELSPTLVGDWSETLLHSFNFGQPVSGLTIDSLGNLFGTAQLGGDFLDCTFGCGVVFEFTH